METVSSIFQADNGAVPEVPQGQVVDVIEIDQGVVDAIGDSQQSRRCSDKVR